METIVREPNKKVKQTVRELLKKLALGKRRNSVSTSWAGYSQERVFEIALQEFAFYCLIQIMFQHQGGHILMALKN